MAEVADVFKPSKRAVRRVSKYRNKRVQLDGIRFDSMKEAARYSDLKWLERAGKIEGLRVHPRYPIEWNGVPICTVIPDFEYHENGVKRLEDVKGMRKGAAYQMFKLKAKLLEAAYGMEVRVV